MRGASRPEGSLGAFDIGVVRGDVAGEFGSRVRREDERQRREHQRDAGRHDVPHGAHLRVGRLWVI